MNPSMPAKKPRKYKKKKPEPKRAPKPLWVSARPVDPQVSIAVAAAEARAETAEQNETPPVQATTASAAGAQSGPSEAPRSFKKRTTVVCTLNKKSQAWSEQQMRLVAVKQKIVFGFADWCSFFFLYIPMFTATLRLYCSLS